MTAGAIDLILDESNWPAASLLLAILAVAAVWARGRRGSVDRLGAGRALDLFYGCLIGTMGSGHLLAVTIKDLQGTLAGPPILLYPLGLALAVPGWWLAGHATRSASEREAGRRRSIALNAWLGVSLLAFGPHNWPLALLAALNLAYRWQSRPLLGRAIVTLAVAAYLALFVGSLVFLASGQSFEQFADVS